VTSTAFRVLTVAEARERLRDRTGFTVQEILGDLRTKGLGGCWIAADDERAPNGHGSWLAYYEAEFGTVPAGMVIRFLCGGQELGCVRPSHMEALPEGDALPAPELPRPKLPELAQRLQDEREARRMTVIEFAAELKISRTQLESWSGARSVPDMRELTWIARHLGWDDVERDWTVTFLQQRVVRGARSSGEAVRAVWNEIDAETPGLRKTSIVSVDAVAPRGGRRLR
jgi:transcriptional regulator with XRE-family HTH domain